MYAEPFFKFDNQEYLILQQSAQKTIKEEAEYLIQQTYGSSHRLSYNIQQVANLTTPSKIEHQITNEQFIFPENDYSLSWAEKELFELGSADYQDLIAALYDNLPPSSNNSEYGDSGITSSLNLKENLKKSNNCTFKCFDCNFETKSRTQFWRHRKNLQHSLKLSKNFKILKMNKMIFNCNECDYQTRHKFNLTRHNKRKHLNLKNEKCNECGKLFKDRDTLRTHYIYVHNSSFSNKKESFKEVLPQHNCHDCLKKFHTASDLLRHQKIVHEKLRQYECSLCQRHFQTLYNVKRHLLRTSCGHHIRHDKMLINSKILKMSTG